MIRRPPRSTPLYSSAASDVYKRQVNTSSAFGRPDLAIPQSTTYLDNFRRTTLAAGKQRLGRQVHLGHDVDRARLRGGDQDPVGAPLEHEVACGAREPGSELHPSRWSCRRRAGRTWRAGDWRPGCSRLPPARPLTPPGHPAPWPGHLEPEPHRGDAQAEHDSGCHQGVLVHRIGGGLGEAGPLAARQEISEETWAVLAPRFPVWKGNGRPSLDMRRTLEGIAWRFRTVAPWRDRPG